MPKRSRMKRKYAVVIPFTKESDARLAKNLIRKNIGLMASVKKV